MKSELIFYTVAATIIGLIAQVLGASLAVILLSSLLLPPVLLLAYRIYNR